MKSKSSHKLFQVSLILMTQILIILFIYLQQKGEIYIIFLDSFPFLFTSSVRKEVFPVLFSFTVNPETESESESVQTQ